MKKILLLLTAASLWNCTDYAADWNSKYENSFAENEVLESSTSVESSSASKTLSSSSVQESSSSKIPLSSSLSPKSSSSKSLSSSSLKSESSSSRIVSSSSVEPESSSSKTPSSSSLKSESSSSITLSSSSVMIASYEFLDERDNKVYRKVEIGSQVWMAQNLNYATSESSCYGGVASNCDKYGRLYTQSGAAQACPSGWHLPSSNEWVKILTLKGTCKALRKDGTDLYGFSALQAGTSENAPGTYAIFWTSDSGMKLNIGGSSGEHCDIYKAASGEKIPVRCIKD